MQLLQSSYYYKVYFYRWEYTNMDRDESVHVQKSGASFTSYIIYFFAMSCFGVGLWKWLVFTVDVMSTV